MKSIFKTLLIRVNTEMMKTLPIPGRRIEATEFVILMFKFVYIPHQCYQPCNAYAGTCIQR